ncbi:MAG: TIGR02147 family protein [Pseudomonadota bacterium]|nr:TIGR02147 family protein [Pseudomonadota bacterium]
MTPVYEFGSFPSYFDYVRRFALPKTKRPLTLQKLSQKLGYKSPRLVGMVLKGQRAPSEEMIAKLIQTLRLNQGESRYLKLLVELERLQKKGLSTESILAELDELSPKTSHKKMLEVNTFTYIAEWFHLVIKQLLNTSTFRNDPDWIRKKLRGKVTVRQAKRALEVLEQLDLIKKEGMSTTAEIPSEAIRLHHAQMMDRAKEALIEQSLDKRHMVSVTLRVDPQFVGEAKAMITRFRNNFDKKFSSLTSSHIFQMNLQFFEHTGET